jgi:hypothetical protein
MNFFLDKFIFFITLLKCILIHEKKDLRINISYLEFYIKNINFIKHLLFLINRKKFNPLNSKSFQKFINSNKKKWQKLNLNKLNTNQHILVESFVNHPGYTLSNAIISIFLKKIFKDKIIGIIRKGDIKSEVIFRSFGVNDFIYYGNLSFLNKVIYSYKSLKLLKKNKRVSNVINLKYQNIDVGLASYDAYIRHSGNPTLEKINCELIVFLSQALYSCDFFSNILTQNNKIKKSVQSETSFIPLNCLFQLCLKNKIQVFSKFGKDGFTLRKYTHWKQRYSFRGKFSQHLFDEIYKNHKSKAIKEVAKLQNRKFKAGIFGMDVGMYNYKELSSGKTILEILDQESNTKLNQNTLIYDKQGIRKLFNWNKKKIVVFFLSFLLDRNYQHGYRINFKDNYSWNSFVLKQISKLKNVNWIIKDHPKYEYTKKNLREIILNLEKKHKHIKSWPQNIENKSLVDITDIALTSSGTVGIEYPPQGVSAIFSEKSPYSNLNFMKMIKSKKKIIKTMKNIHKIKKPTSTFIEKCKIYSFIFEILTKQKCFLLPNYIASRSIDEDQFWKACNKKVNNFTFSKDIFFKMLKKQLMFNLRHTVNYNLINFKKKRFNDFED